ncbi:tRNA lysidine(34) synthetase TilS [Aliikangiella sp. IMCC44632]
MLLANQLFTPHYSKTMPKHSIETQLITSIREYDSAGTYWVGLSGGVDSMVLLTALLKVRTMLAKGQPTREIKIGALHVNHGLHSQADEWQQVCEQFCEENAIELETTQLKLLSKQEKGKSKLSNLEEVARKARYAFFSSQLKTNDVIFLAHHLDDQAETLLYRLFRGTGLRGAVGIPKVRSLAKGKLVRPLLEFTRAQIEEYARLQKVSWVDDPSNKSSIYQRNFIRNQVLPLIKQHWPQVAQTIARFTQVASEQRELLEDIAKQDLVECQVALPEIILDTRAATLGYLGLNLDKLKTLSTPRQKNLIYYYYQINQSLAPSSVQIEELLRQISASSSRSVRLTLRDSDLVTCNGVLQFNRAFNLAEKFAATKWSDLQQPLSLSNGLLVATCTRTGGLRKPSDGEVVEVKTREGGEKILPHYRNKAASLKIIFQEKNIPKELRAKLPLIFYNDQLVAVPGVFLAKDYLLNSSEIGIDFQLSF